MSEVAGARLKPGLTVLGILGSLGVLAPLLANDQPLVLAVGGRVEFPAAADLPLVGRFFSGAPTGERTLEGGHPAGTWVLPSPVPYSYREVRLEETLEAPSFRHLMGTDTLGRDILARVLHGASVSLLVGFGATLLSLGLGSLLGGAAGLKGGIGDLILSRLIEILGCFPPFLLAMALVAITGGAGLYPIILAIGVGRAASSARFVRGEILRFKGGVVWHAARSTGSTLPRIALRHILPLLAPPLLVQSIFGIAQSILLESGLSFLGVGVQPPFPSWGMILAEGRGTLEVAWWPIAFPSLALAVTLGSLAWAAEPATAAGLPSVREGAGRQQGG